MDPSDHRLRAFTYQFGGQDFVLNDKTGTYETDDATKAALQKFIDLNNDGTIPKRSGLLEKMLLQCLRVE